jgi:2-polyprenyl-3-methyl-5-hydroxy-6-metoxy-1,4-benzoquinol methylase
MTVAHGDKVICKICGGDDVSVFGKIANGNYSASFLKDYSLLKCEKCSLKFIYPTPSDEALDFIYSNPEYSAWETSTEKEGNIRYVNFEHYLKTIKKHVNGGKLLDCGCATGYFLDVAKENGFDCYGIETSQIPFSISEIKHPQKVFKKNIEELSAFDSFFDIITMFDFIEHVKDPSRALRKANGLLKTGGYLVMTTPDTKSLSMTLLGKKHTNYILEHINLLNHELLLKYFENLGFEIASISPAKKMLTLKYAENVFKVHGNFLHKPMKMVNYLLPKGITGFPIKISFGDMLVIAQKK